MLLRVALQLETDISGWYISPIFSSIPHLQGQNCPHAWPLKMELTYPPETSVTNFEESHPCCVYQIIKYQICIDIQSEHNYVILWGIIQRINYMFRPLLGHHQVALRLQINCIIQSAYLIGDEISFTMVRYMNPMNRMVPIFAIFILNTIFCSYCWWWSSNGRNM